MENKVTKEKAISGFFWTLAEKFGAVGVSFVVSIILARLLTPEDYGSVAIVSVFTSIANVFVKSGLGSALIQKKDADTLDFSTVFYFNVVFSIIIYAIVFVGAPYVAKFYSNNELTTVLRVSAIALLLNGINNVQQAYVSKHLEFKKFFLSTAIGTVISAIVGITMAFNGCGVWSLVVQQLLNQVFNTIILHMTISWSPTLEFSWERLKKMYSFGWKLLITDLSNSIYNNLQAMIIGKKYSSEQLAFYNKGNTFPQLLVRNLDNSIQSVTFPILASEQNNQNRFTYIMYRACTLSFYLVCPMMLGMICVAKPLITILLTEKWLGCVPFMQLYCITYLLRPIEMTNTQALYALGRSDITLKIDIIKKVYGVLAVILAVIFFDDAIAICLALVICTFLNTLISMVAVSKIVKFGVWQQIKNISGILLASLIMGLICVTVGRCLSNANVFVVLIAQIVCGIAIYVFMSKLLKLDSFEYLFNYVKKLLVKK